MLLCYTGWSQSCDANVPVISIDLSATPDTSWTLLEADAPTREGYCCGASGSTNCISFEITLHPNSAGIFFDYDGAPAFGSLRWRLDCGPEYTLRDTICVTDPGPFTLSFCKSGSDNGNYTLISVAKPTFPESPQNVPANCIQPVEILGVTANSVSWISISPGNPGDYDGQLSCTNCLTPTFTPDPNGPSEIEYRVCGYPILDYCVGNIEFCDTVKFIMQDSLKVSVSPINPAFCAGGDITLTATGIGGDGNYSYIWYDNGLNIIGTGANLVVDQAGSYSVEVRDGNYEPGACDNMLSGITVVETTPPSVDAGEDVVVCADNPTASLNGVINFATGGTWSGGAGTYTDDLNDLSLSYTPTQAEIAAGSVVLTLASTGAGSGCINTSDQVEVFFVDTIQTTLSDQDLSCFGGTMLMDPSVSGGMAPFQYIWSDNSVNPTNEVGAGAHCVTITDAIGCQVTECFTVSTPSQLLADMSNTPVTSDGLTDGTATVDATGGTAPYTYLWSTSGTTATIAGLPYGVYTVTVTDDNGCQQEGSTVVNEPRCNGFSASTTKSDVQCNGDNTGEAEVLIVGGQAPFDILWNDPLGQTSAIASNLAAGAYQVLVTDDNACFAVSSASIFEPTQVLNSFTSSDASILGGSDGAATANPIGGTPAYTYFWSNGETTQSISDLTAGWYIVTITDDNGCSLVDSTYINEPPCNEMALNVNVVSPVCNGDKTGEADLMVLNGVGPYAITWSTGEINVSSIANVEAGVHNVEVTDSRGCYVFKSFGISEPTAVSLALEATPSTCVGSDNGTIDLSVVGGTFPYYYYAWDNGATTEDVINLAPGSYAVVVTDEMGCTASSSASVTDPDALDIAYSVSNVTCYEGTDGAIDVTVTGGSLPYNFNWSNGETTEDLSSIDFGGYILNFTDGNGCPLAGAVNIPVDEPEPVGAQDIAIACPVPGANEALVTITPTGGSNMNYEISFDGGSTFLPAGDYDALMATGQAHSILIQDNNGCTSLVQAFDIDATVVIDAIDFNKCYTLSQTDETITVSMSGGTSDYSVSFDNGASFNAVGTYTLDVPINATHPVVVMDAKGCVSAPTLIDLPAPLDQSINVTSNFNGAAISCNGLSDGELTSSATGGSAPYDFEWANGVFTANNANLSAGMYSVTVTDAEGCIISGNFTLLEPDPVVATASITSDYNGFDISCNGGSNGEAMVNNVGGVGPYSSEWSNGMLGDFCSTMNAGMHTVTVIDANGCMTTSSVTLDEPTEMGMTSTPTDATCNGFTDGSIDLNPTGGVAPYTFNWSNGALTEDISGIGVGSYDVTVTDNNGCVDNMSTAISAPTTVVLSAVETAVKCYGGNDGAVDLTPVGGTGPYTVSWDNGAGTEDIGTLSAGTYVATVMDAQGCMEQYTATVAQPDDVVLSALATDPACNGFSNGSVDLSVVGGIQPYTYAWSNGPATEDVQSLSIGGYQVTVTDANGCVKYGNYTLLEPAVLDVELTSPENFHGHNISFANGSDGVIYATVTGGTEQYTYYWSNGMSSEDISGLAAGEFTLVVVDAQGCQASRSIHLRDPLDLELPTAFSPNQDGFNDEFFIRGLDAYPNNKVIITNRWGNIVFEEEAYKNNWKGTNKNGDDLPEGVYFVILEIDGTTITRENYLHIKRNQP